MSARRDELCALFEAILFASGDPLSRERLLGCAAGADREPAEAALAALEQRHDGSGASGLLLEEVAGGLRLVTRPELGEDLRRFFDAGSRSRLTMAALETLAIVAYRQPITAPEIQELRGVSPGGVLRTLLERHLIRIAGRKEVVGRPFLYATTRDFLVHFGLRSLQELPALEDLEELMDDAGTDFATGVAAAVLGDAAERVTAEAEEEAGQLARAEETAAEAAAAEVGEVESP